MENKELRSAIAKKAPLVVSFIFAFGIGLFLLATFGESLISEVTQEVVVAGSESADTATARGRAPRWELASLTGARKTASDFLGTTLVLTFWTTWNKEAVNQLRILDDYLAGQSEDIAAIAAIAHQETKDAVLHFQRRSGYQVPIFIDETGAVGETYEVRVVPTTYFIDRDGIIRERFVGVLSAEMLREKVERIVR